MGCSASVEGGAQGQGVVAMVLPPFQRPSASTIVQRRRRSEKGQLQFDVFLSHRRNDADELARSLNESLQHGHGISCFLDRNPSPERQMDLLDSVCESATLVLILSSQLFESHWCAQEVRTALEWEIPIILVTKEGSSWSGESFPPTATRARWPAQLQEAFKSIALPHSKNHYSEFVKDLVGRIGPAQKKLREHEEQLQGETAGGHTTSTDSSQSSQPAAAPRSAAQGSVTSLTPTPVQMASSSVRGPAAHHDALPSVVHEETSAMKADDDSSTDADSGGDDAALLFATPEESPLIQRKLADPHKSMSVDDSILLLTQCILYGRRQARRSAGKHLLLFIGNTGAGKSTLVNYLAGCSMASKNPRELGLKGLDNVVVVRPPEEGGALAQLMPIGHTRVSKTFMPHIEPAPKDSGIRCTFCDCPGFLDSRGAEINIANAVNVRAAIQAAASVRVIVLINYFSLKSDRGRGVTEMLRLCANLFGAASNVVHHQASLLLGVSNVPARLPLGALRDWLADDTSTPLLRTLSERVFTFDPLDAELPEGGWTRPDLLQHIANLVPISAANARSIFATVLTADDETTLQRLAATICSRVEEQLCKNSFVDASDTLRPLRSLSIVGHAAVDRAIATATDAVRNAWGALASSVAHQCGLEHFDEAAGTLRDMTALAAAFVDLVAFYRPSVADCEATLAAARQRAQVMATREAALKSQIAAAEGRAEEMMRLLEAQRLETETRLQEQNTAHTKLAEELQLQVERTGQEFQAMEESLLANMKAQLQHKTAELQAIHGQSADELQRRTEAEKERLQEEFSRQLAEAEQRRDEALKQQRELQRATEAERIKEVAKRRSKVAELKKKIAQMREEESRRAKETAEGPGNAELNQRMLDHNAQRAKYEAERMQLKVPVNMTYSDRNLVLYSFQQLVPKHAKLSELGPIAMARVETIKKKDDPAYESPDQLVVMPMHYFAVSTLNMVRDLSLDGRVAELESYLVKGCFSVNIVEETKAELKLRQHSVMGERIIWIRRYYPVASNSWRPAGVPFTFVFKDGESVRAFRARLQQRLNYNNSQMAQVEMAMLSRVAMQRQPITKDDDLPWQIISHDIQGRTQLGVYDPLQATAEAERAKIAAEI